MKDLPQNIRERVIALHRHTSKTQQEISADLDISQNAVSLIIRRFEATGMTTTMRRGKCGRKPKLTTREKNLIVRESKKDPSLTASEIKTRSGAVGEKVSLTTVRQTLRDYGRKVYRTRRVPLLDRAKRVARLAWAIEYKSQPMEFWSKVSSLEFFWSRILK
jgi:transposase